MFPSYRQHGVSTNKQVGSSVFKVCLQCVCHCEKVYNSKPSVNVKSTSQETASIHCVGMFHLLLPAFTFNCAPWDNHLSSEWRQSTACILRRVHVFQA